MSLTKSHTNTASSLVLFPSPSRGPPPPPSPAGRQAQGCRAAWRPAAAEVTSRPADRHFDGTRNWNSIKFTQTECDMETARMSSALVPSSPATLSSSQSSSHLRRCPFTKLASGPREGKVVRLHCVGSTTIKTAMTHSMQKPCEDKASCAQEIADEPRRDSVRSRLVAAACAASILLSPLSPAGTSRRTSGRG